MPSQCSALNKTTGRRCKSRPSNPCGTCSRHTPQPPSEEELATAIAQLRQQLAATPLQPVPPEESLADPALTVEQLEELYTASRAAWFNHPAYHEHLALNTLCRFLELENEFTVLFGQILRADLNRLYYEMAITDRQKELREAAVEAAERAAMNGPLGETVEELQAQMALIHNYYEKVEAADMGAGYQVFQIYEFRHIDERLAAIRARIAELELPAVASTCWDCRENLGEDASVHAASSCWGCRENQPNQLAHTDPGGCLYQEEVW